MLDGFVNASLDVGGVHAGLDLLVAFLVDGSGKDGGGCGSVSGLIVGLIGDILDESGADVGGFVGKLDSLGDSDTVLGDFWGAEALVDEDVPASWAEGDLNCVRELLASLEELLACLATEEDFFGCEVALDIGEGAGVSAES